VSTQVFVETSKLNGLREIGSNLPSLHCTFEYTKSSSLRFFRISCCSYSLTIVPPRCMHRSGRQKCDNQNLAWSIPPRILLSICMTCRCSSFPVWKHRSCKGRDQVPMPVSCLPPGHWCWRSGPVGSAWTTLHLRYEQAAAAVLGTPSHIRQAALLPVAYYTGEDFKPTKRVLARERTYWNGW